MGDRYRQVALTYLRPWSMRAAAGGVALSITLLAACAANRRESVFGLLVAGVGLAACSAACIAAHLKEQLADSRSSLTPSFRAPHLIVGALTLLGTLLLLCAVMAFWMSAPPSYSARFAGLFALTLFMAAATAWVAHLQNVAGWIASFALILTLAFQPVRALAFDILVGLDITALTLVLLAGLAGFGGLWLRLARMHAEMPEYNLLLATNWRLGAAMTGDARLRRASANETARLNDLLRPQHRLDHPGNIAGARFWTRVRHWRLVTGAGRTPWIVGGAICAWILLMQRFNQGGSGWMTAPLIIGSEIMIIMLPIGLAGHAWPQRWYTLGIESLRPVGREQFIREQGAAMLLDLFSCYVILAAALIILIAMQMPSAHLDTLWAVLFAGAVGQLPLFGLNMWVLRYRRGWLSISTLIFRRTVAELAVVVLAGWTLRGIDDPFDPSGYLLLLGGTLLLGIIIIADAYRRWCRTDLG